MKMKQLFVLLVLGLLFAFKVSTAWSANTVYSTDIVNGEVKTDDIASGAVTSAKIADWSITTVKLGSQVVNSYKLADSAVTGPKIENGAVTDAKISGTISISKLPVGTTGSTVAVGDHNHEGLYQKKYSKVAVVALSGGDYTSPATAMSNIASWCGTPSSSNVCLLKVMPGTYEVAEFTVSSYVEVIGAGIDFTTLHCDGNNALTVNSHAVLESLTVVTEGIPSEGNVYSVALLGVNPQVRNLKSVVSGGDTNLALFIQGSTESAIVDKVEAIANGTDTNVAIQIDSNATVTISESSMLAANGDFNLGLRVLGNYQNPESTVLKLFNSKLKTTSNYSASMTVDYANVEVVNSIVEATGSTVYGVYVSNYGMSGAGKVRLDRSTVISSGGAAVYKTDGDDMFIGGSRIEGTVTSPEGALKCVGSYDGGYDALDSACQ